MNRKYDYATILQMEKTWNIVKKILIIFILSRIVLFSVGVISNTYIQPLKSGISYEIVESSGMNLTLQRMWFHFDSFLYTNIAQNGYPQSEYSLDKYNIFGMLPFYPIIIGILGKIVLFGNYQLAGLLISNICLIFSAYYLFRISEKMYNRDVAMKSIILLFAFPFSFVFSGIFSESLFLFLVLFSYWSFINNSYKKSSISLALACITKPIGILFILPIIHLLYKKYSFRRDFFKHLSKYSLVPLSLILLGIFYYFRTGDFFAYSTVQNTAFYHSWSNPFHTIASALFNSNPAYIINSSYILFIIGIIATLRKHIPQSLAILSLLLILFAPTTGFVVDSFRYSAVIFPLYIMVANYAKDEYRFAFIVSLFSIIQGALMVFWVGNFWFVS
jgi:Gpi18-like mannosyltransferase